MGSQMNAGKNSNASSTHKPGLARNVTKDTLTLKAKVFVEMGSGEWVSVGKPSDLTNGEARVREFGAWIEYFKTLGMPTRWYEERVNITVPARWPHMFDAEREVQTDYAAAGVWMDQVEMERRLDLETTELTPEQKQKVVSKLKAKWWPNGKPPRQKTPEAHLADLPSSDLDVGALVESAERDLAEHLATQASKNAEPPSKGTPLRNFEAFQEGTPDVF
jgi:hypothetical protein